MKDYSAEEIDSLIQRFERQELPKPEWTHEAHLVVAIWYNYQLDKKSAMDRVRDLITRHNTSVGTPNTDSEGYHETITQFWMNAADGFIAERKSRSVYDLCSEFIQSDFASSSTPLQFYSEAVLFSVEARHNWVEPNRRG
ncbi:hypothetical protein [Phaeocystidibacter luteus]|uniref:Uncharacterized protein n=1 Tax=Phaeocystidibacter luteus TaxID=911197 RepID=A0A6N6RES0_9FLAO|nr:hypothetical protein [Phaeocystidibacter luteus]KAB2808666.1 hypothetical protein F8C67_10290 [Phaeocystidibacter luteus]